MGQRNHRAAAGKDKKRVYFPPKLFFLLEGDRKNQKRRQGDCQSEPYGAHCYPADERLLNRQLQKAKPLQTEATGEPELLCFLILSVKAPSIRFTGLISAIIWLVKVFMDTEITQSSHDYQFDP